MAEPTNEQRKAIGAFVKGTLSPLIEEVLTKKLSQSAAFIAEELRAEAAMAATVTDEQIQAVWQSMPGGPDGFRKQWGFMQFARAVLALVEAEDGVDATPARKDNELAMLGYELDGVLADVERGKALQNFDATCVETLQRVSARLHKLAAGVNPSRGTQPKGGN